MVVLLETFEFKRASASRRVEESKSRSESDPLEKGYEGIARRGRMVLYQGVTCHMSRSTTNCEEKDEGLRLAQMQ